MWDLQVRICGRYPDMNWELIQVPVGHLCLDVTRDMGFYLFISNVYLLLRERKCEWGRGREREGDTESEAGSSL